MRSRMLPLVLLLLYSAPLWALEPDEIALIVNSLDADSRRLADYYCQKRRVPIENIIKLPLPLKERITRREYEYDIAPVIREKLRSRRMQGIKCLLTLRGVPLYIGGVILDGPLKGRRDLINDMLNSSFDELQQLAEDFQQITQAGPTEKITENTKKSLPQPFRLSTVPFKRNKTAYAILQKAHKSALAAQKWLNSQDSKTAAYRQKRDEFRQLALKLGGLRSRVQGLGNKIKYITDEQEKEKLATELDDLRRRLRLLAAEKRTIESGNMTISDQKRRYQLVREAGGLQLLCQMLLADRRAVGDDESNSSFDSELSLILWPRYDLVNQQPNRLFVRKYRLPVQYNTPDKPGPTMMVSRLDGPSLKIALGLVDKALIAEKTTLTGKAYFDARGFSGRNKAVTSYGYYDESIRRAAELVRKETDLQVILDNKPALFPENSCPDAVLYCGWYKLKHYVDAFGFKTGAVGYHIASFEAATLRNPSSQVWCKRLLEKGITATLGPVAEPYLHAFPLPELFFKDLISGKYCLVECFYRNKPFNSWMMVLIGDPLYRMKIARTLVNEGG